MSAEFFNPQPLPIQDLRPGSWLDMKAGKLVRAQVEMLGQKPEELVKLKGQPMAASLNLLWGIPLSRQILEAFQFQVTGEDQGFYAISTPNQGAFTIAAPEPGWQQHIFLNRHPILYHRKIHFLHQLQNLIWDLAAVELTLKPKS